MKDYSEKLKIPLVTLIVGTRPELIKLAPLIKAFKNSKDFKTRLILTGQHKEMVINLIKIFQLEEDLNLDIHIKGQTLSYITSAIINGLKKNFH